MSLDQKQKGEHPGGCLPFEKILNYDLRTLMIVAVGLTLVSRMIMVVHPVVPQVLMIMNIRATLVGMLMAVFVQVLVSVHVGVFVGVRFTSVSMFMAVFVSVLVGM